MTEVAVGRRYTAEDLLRMEDGDSYELDDGELVEVPVGFESRQSRTTLPTTDRPVGLAWAVSLSEVRGAFRPAQDASW